MFLTAHKILVLKSPPNFSHCVGVVGICVCVCITHNIKHSSGGFAFQMTPEVSSFVYIYHTHNTYIKEKMCFICSVNSRE